MKFEKVYIERLVSTPVNKKINSKINLANDILAKKIIVINCLTSLTKKMHDSIFFVDYVVRSF